MRLLLCCFAWASLAPAGVIQGTVIELASGLPLARTLIRLAPVPKPGGEHLQALQVRAGRTGYFIFPAVAEGLYLLTATREGYFPAAYGQRRPTGQAIPFAVRTDTDLFTDLRMRRMGAITGRVLDENGVGMPGAPVVAYRARLPLRTAARAVSDDRGVYRIHGLSAGKYWVRSAPFTLEDGSGRLPTFGPESRETRDARVHEVRVDGETTDADVRPEPGNLFRFSGKVLCDRTDGPPVTVTLSSETGRRSTQVGCNQRYVFEDLAPAVYEIFATDGTDSSFAEYFIDHESAIGNLQLTPPPQVDFDLRRPGSSGQFNGTVALKGRRQDLAQTDAEHDIPTSRTSLPPGHWEFYARAGSDYFIESISNARPEPRRPSRIVAKPEEWSDVFIQMRAPALIRITVSDQAGIIAGTVKTEGKAIVGIPVFLWPMEEAARRSLHGPQQVLTDTEGRFAFRGLPPGDYRLLATFDITEVDEEAMQAAQAVVARAVAAQSSMVELTPWLMP